MTSKHTFDSIQKTEIKNFDSNISNVHSFNSILSFLKNYNITIEDFFETDSWFAIFRQQNNISVGEITMITKSLATFSKSDSMSVSYPLTLMTIKETASFRQENNISAIMNSLLNMGNATFTQSNRITISMVDKNIISSGVVISIPQTVMNATATAASYYMVSDWDSSLLSDLDAMNLDDMDYQIV